MEKRMHCSIRSALVSVFLGIILCGFTFAQQNAAAAAPPIPPQSGTKKDAASARLERMSEHLNLTQQQESTIRPILQEEAKRARAIRTDNSLSAQQKRSELQELHRTSQGLIQGVLTPEQIQKMNAFGPARATPHPSQIDRMFKNLDLTADQKARIEPIFVAQEKQIQAVGKDPSLSQRQKKARIREIRQATHRQIMPVLTPEQQQKMQMMRHTGMDRHRGYGQVWVPTRSRCRPLHRSSKRMSNGKLRVASAASFCHPKSRALFA